MASLKRWIRGTEIACLALILAGCGSASTTEPGTSSTGTTDSTATTGAGGSTTGTGGSTTSASTSSTSSTGSGGGDPDFVPVPEHLATGPLCAIPDGYVENGGDPTFITCDVEAGRFSDRDPSQVPASLKAVEWNVEFGKASAAILAELQGDPDLAGADFILLAEVARESLTSEPANIDQARELAMALQMDFVFAVSWDRRLLPEERGEHGVAVLSKYPLGNLVQIRHTPLNDWYAEDQLYGGRITLGVDAKVGQKLLRLYSSHLCTRGNGGSGRAMQAAEIRADADLPGRPAAQIAGGDLNTWTCNPLIANCTVPPAAEQTVQDFLAAGWLDGTAGYTGPSQLGNGFFPQRLDWIFYRGASAATPGKAATTTGSDHSALFFSMSL